MVEEEKNTSENGPVQGLDWELVKKQPKSKAKLVGICLN